MWLDNLLEFRETNKQHLNFKIELHLAIYIMKILKDRIEFKLTKNKTKEFLSIHLYDEDKKKSSLTEDKFMYWWAIERYDEIISEEELILSGFNELKEKVILAEKKTKNPVVMDSDSEDEKEKKLKQIQDNDNKIQKLKEHLKKESDKSNIKLSLLSQFRMMNATNELLKNFLESVKIIVMN
jgi:hypothetical protein